MPSARSHAIFAACALALTAGAAQTASANGASTGADADADAPVVDAIVVTAASRSKVERTVQTGVLGSKSALETPFSVEAVTTAEIRNLQTKDINGVFRADASVKEINSSVAQASGAAFRIRGVATDQLNSFKVDGLTVPYWSIDLPIDQFDQIQLLKGATGFVYGFGSPAGVINFITKKPPEAPIREVDVGYRSDSLFSGHVDVGGRLDDGRYGYRVNLQSEKGDVYNGGYNYNYSGALALDARLSDSLTWRADGFYMKTYQREGVNTVSVGPNVTSLATVPGDTNFGAVGAWKTNEMNMFTTGLDWQIDSNWKATLEYRRTKLDENFPGNLITITNNAGAYTASAFFVQRMFDFNQVQGLVQGSFDTGPLRHEIVVGATLENQHYWSDANSPVTHPLAGGNIYVNPQTTLAAYPSSLYNPKLYELNDYRQKSLFAADTLSWGPWSLLLAVRYTDYTNTVRGPTNAVTAVYTAKPATPTYALTYAVAKDTRLYASFTKGLQNGGAAGATNVNNGETFGPIETKQYEAGIKTQHANWNATAAAFLTKQDANFVTTANVYVQSGKARYRGVEGSATVNPTPDWTLSASAIYLDTTYLDEGPVYTGKEIPGVPKVQATFRAAYSPPQLPGLTLAGDAKYTGKGYGDTVNTLAFPSYTTVDLAASYATEIEHTPIIVRVGVKNVGDKRYWTYGSSTVIPGEPRTFVAGLQADF